MTIKTFIFLLFFQLSNIFAQNYPNINDFIEVDKNPIPINLDKIKNKIIYPKELKEMGIYGKCVIRVLVDSLGNIVDCKTIRSPHPIMTNYYESILFDLKLQPAMKNGKAIACWVNVPFDYHPR